MTEEIIARKKNIGWLYILCAVIGIALIILSCIVFKGSSKYLYISFGALVVVICGVISIRIARTPSVVIKRRGDELILPNGTFKISQLSNVIARRAHTRGISYLWGSVILTIDGTDMKYSFIADVESVQRRLTELMLSGKNS